MALRFALAAKMRWPFKKHKDRRLDDIAVDDLEYLDYMYGQMSKKPHGQRHSFFPILRAYMEDSSIKKEVAAMVQDRD